MRERAILCRASAGSGKTFQLTTRFVALLLDGWNPERILATTFTRKAAGEILHRVCRLLLEAAESEQGRERLGVALGVRISNEACVRALDRLLDTLGGLNVLTIDALLARDLRARALEIGLDPGFRVLGDEEADAARRHAVRRLVSSADPAVLAELVSRLHDGAPGRSVHGKIVGVLDSVTPALRAAGAHRELWTAAAAPPTAHPGSPEALLDEVRALPISRTQSGAPRRRWLDARDRVASALASRDPDALVGITLLDRARDGEAQYDRAPITDDWARALRSVCAYRDAALIKRFADRNRAAFDLAERFEACLAAEKQRLGALQFDDVPRLLVALRGEGPPRPDERFDHVLLDEFQDTSLEQFALLERTLDELLSSEDDRTVFIVGDAKQSLYGWRGAEPALMDALPDRWPALAEAPLVVSWRSSPAVIHAVNSVFSRLGDVDGLGEAGSVWTSRFVPHRAQHAELPGCVRLLLTDEPASEDDTAHQDEEAGDPGSPSADAIVRCVQRIRTDDPRAGIAVLVRYSRSAAPIRAALRARGIASSDEAGAVLIDEPAVRAFVGLLDVIVDPSDRASLLLFASSPLGPALGLAPDAGTSPARLDELADRIAEHGFADLIDALRRDSALSGEDDAALSALTRLAVEHDAIAHASPRRFASAIRHARAADPSPDAVRVMTVHAAKGLEFDAVIVAGLDRPMALRNDTVLIERESPLDPVTAVSMYPNETIRSAAPRLQAMHEAALERHIEQELCCLYVAMTRAKRWLDLIVPSRVLTGTRPRNPRLADVLVETLAPGARPDADGVLWRRQHGEPTPARAASAPTPARRTPRPPPPVGAAPSDPRPWRPLDLGALDAIDRGTAIHAELAEVVWPSASGSRWADRPAVAGALSRDRYAAWGADVALEVRPEAAFALEDAEGVDGVRLGRIDRLVLGLRGGRVVRAEVIDFKTGGASDDERMTAYAEQVTRYADAVCSAYGLERGAVDATLVFVDADRVVPIPA